MSAIAYDVKIEGTEQINFNKDTDNEGASISKVIFKMNTLNDDSLNRDSAVRCELIVEGKITQDNKNETLKLTKWSMIGSGEGIYRKVTVIVYTDDSRNEVLRQYTVDKMFCIDYDESFSEDVKQGEAGRFILHIAQREGNHSKDVFAD
jgi:hypothetical protein